MVKRTFEEKQNITEEDIHLRLKALAPLLQQEYLENLLKRFNLQLNLKVLASKKLAELYAQRGMLSSAAKIMTNAAMAVETFAAKEEMHMSAGMLSVKAGDYLLADDNFKWALNSAAPSDKARVQKQAADFYLKEAAELEKTGKIAKAAHLYDRLLRSENTKEESTKRMIKEKLMVLYEKLGKIQESLRMRDSLK